MLCCLECVGLRLIPDSDSIRDDDCAVAVAIVFVVVVVVVVGFLHLLSMYFPLAFILSILLALMVYCLNLSFTFIRLTQVRCDRDRDSVHHGAQSALSFGWGRPLVWVR